MPQTRKESFLKLIVMTSLKRIIRLAFSLPKTIFFNLYMFPIKIAVKLPILIDYRTQFNELYKNTVVLSGNIKFGMVKLGWGNGSNGIECNRKSYWGIKKGSKVVFKGTAQFAKGVSLRADNGGEIIFGNQLTANQNFFCASNTSVSFGENVVLGWNIHVRDADGHPIFNQNGDRINENRCISVGDHVWIASYASILKGVTIPDNCIVGFGSIVTKSFKEQGLIIGGIPAIEVKKNINWEI